MQSGLERVLSRRMWFVPDYEVWGLAEWGSADFLVAEGIGSEISVGYGSQSLGSDAQSVAFADLSDHRGNQLPDSLDAARVVVRPRGAETAFVVGGESSSGFKIARDASAVGPVTVDLLIIELGS